MKISGVESFCVVTRDGKPWVVLFDKFYFCGFDEDTAAASRVDSTCASNRRRVASGSQFSCGTGLQSDLRCVGFQIAGIWVQNEQNVTDIRKWLYAPNFRDMQPSMPIFAVVSHPKVVTEPVATLSIVFHYPTNVVLIPHYL